jgi:uncharacterized protein YcaQ
MKEFEKDHIKSYLVDHNGLRRRTDFSSFCGSLHTSLKCIQFDPLNIIGRNADLVLNSRVSDYRRDQIRNKLYKERTLVDGWDKMMSVYSMQDWKKLQRIRDYKKTECKMILARRGILDSLEYVDTVKAELAQSSGIQGKDLKLGRRESGSWGQKNVASIVLDYLFMTGEVGIKDKIQNQKIYDLIERIIPGDIYEGEGFANDSDFFAWFVKRRISSVGLLWNKKSVLWQGVGGELYDNDFRGNVFETLKKEGSIVEIKVQSVERPFYINREDLQELERSVRSPAGKEVRFLAPLDNLIWEREQTRELFNFDFSWEVYLPVSKRKYGYYVLPVLYGTDLVGRIEPVIDKTENKLIIKNLWLDAKMDHELYTALLKEVEAFSRYLMCSSHECELDGI